MPNPKRKSGRLREPWHTLTRPETRWLVVGLVLLLVLTALTWVVTEPGGSGGALPRSAAQATLSLTPSAVGTQVISPEVLANRNSTTGIILASLMLVLIVLGGAFFGTRKKSI